MATDLKAQPKHELFVEQQLERVSKRLHTLDLGRIGLLLLAVVMAHALMMALIDLSAGPQAAKWVAIVRYSVWGLSLAGFLFLGCVFLLRLSRRINPYYAAKQIEETIPDAKNSVVNWLDLRAEPLPPVIKTALGLRAARDLKTTDPDQSIHAKKNTWILAVAIGGLVVGLLALFVKEPGRFGSLMQRAFIPMIDSNLATRTRITLLHPIKGDLTVEPQQKIHFQIKIAGVVPRLNTPQAARLLYRYQAEEDWVAVPLDEEADGTWTTSMRPDQVQNGFSYKLVAGDAETSQYQVTVQSQPEAKGFEVSYHYQAYTGISDRTVLFPNQDEGVPRIKGPLGTEVTLVVRTNRELHEGKIELSYADSVKEIVGDLLTDDPKAFRVKFALEKAGQFRVHFTTKAGDGNSDLAPYEMLVIPDNAPFVELRKPGKDIELPANGTLQLEGFSSDDFGIKRLILRLELFNGSGKVPLSPKMYRPEKSFQFQSGGYADRVDYRDFVVLPQLKNLIGDGVPLAKGDVITYWLEATDNCDYPVGQPNIGHSKTFKVTISDNQDAKKQREEQAQAERDQKNHEKRQDEDLKQQELERKQKQQEQKEQGRNNDTPNPDPARTAEEQKKNDELLKRVKEQLDKEKQGQGQEEGTEPGQKKELSGKDVEKLKEMLKKDGRVGDLAEEQLKDAAQNSKDDKVRQQAQEALKNNPKPSGDPSPQDIEKLKEMLKDQGRLGDKAAQDLAKAAKESKDPATQKAAEDALKGANEAQKDPAQKKELTEKDLARLKEMLKDPALKDLARRELKDAAEKNPELSKAAKEALEKQLSPKDIEQLKDLLKDPGPVGDAAKQELKKAAQGSDDIGQAAKEALKDAQRNNPAGKPAPKKDVSKEDIAKFKEMLKDKGPVGDLARQQLKDAMKQARDPAVSKDAADALKNQKGEEPSAKDLEEFNELLKDKGPLGDMVREEMSKIAKETKDDATRQAVEDALKKSPPGTKEPRKDPTKEDIAKLKELLDKPGAVGDLARRELEKAQNAKDPKASDAAKEALKNQKGPVGKEPTAQDVAKLKEMIKDPGAVGDAAAGELAKIAKQANDPATQKAAKEALKAGGREELLKPAPKTTVQPKTEAGKDVTLKEIDQLEKLAKKDGHLGDIGARGLAEAARLANDEKVRKAAQEAIKKLAANKGEEPNLDDVELLKEMNKDKGPLGDAAHRELSRLSTQAKDEKVRKAADEAVKNANRKQSKHDPVRDATLNDVAELEKMSKKEGLTGDLGAQGLAETARLANDEKVRKAAKEALEKRDPRKTDAVTPEDVAALQKLINDPGPLGEAVSREMARLAKESKNPAVREAAVNALKESNRELKANAPDADAARRSGVMSLEDLKKQVTPEMLKKLGYTEEEWNRALKAAEERQRAMNDDPLAQRGDPNLLPSTGPRLVDPSNNNSSTTQSNRGQAPPGWGQVYERWTSRRTNPDGK